MFIVKKGDNSSAIVKYVHQDKNLSKRTAKMAVQKKPVNNLKPHKEVADNVLGQFVPFSLQTVWIAQIWSLALPVPDFEKKNWLVTQERGYLAQKIYHIIRCMSLSEDDEWISSYSALRQGLCKKSTTDGKWKIQILIVCNCACIQKQFSLRLFLFNKKNDFF